MYGQKWLGVNVYFAVKANNLIIESDKSLSQPRLLAGLAEKADKSVEEATAAAKLK